jgi:hypothetical protein
MAAENMVNKRMSQIKDDPTIASNLDAVSDSKHKKIMMLDLVVPKRRRVQTST